MRNPQTVVIALPPAPALLNVIVPWIVGKAGHRLGAGDRLIKRQLGRAIKSDNIPSRIRQRIDRTGDIDRTHLVHHFNRASRSFRQRASGDGCVACLHHDGADAERGGGTEDGADILRVGDLVEDRQRVLRPHGGVGDIDPVQLTAANGQSLVHGAGRQLHVDISRLHDVGEAGQGVDIEAGAFGCTGADIGDADLAQRIVERGAGGVQPPDPDFAILLEGRLAALEGGLVLAVVLVRRAACALVAGRALITPLLWPSTGPRLVAGRLPSGLPITPGLALRRLAAVA